MKHLLDVLQRSGMSTREAHVYVVCLELGAAPASTIARRVNDKRSTIYSILKEFIKKGIATSIIRNGLTFFSVVEPERLLDRWQSLSHDFAAVLPDFLALTDKAYGGCKVQYFEGLEGIKQMYAMTLEYAGGELYAFVNPSQADAQVRAYLNKVYVAQRIEHAVKAYVLLPHEQDHTESYVPLHDVHAQERTEIRRSPEKLQMFENEINIFGEDKVCIFNFSSQEMSGIVIQSKSFYATIKHIFAFIWGQSV